MPQNNLPRASSVRSPARAIAFTLLLSSFGFGLPAAVAIPTDSSTVGFETRLREARVFEEPLIATGPSSIEEQQALWQAIQQYRDGEGAEAFVPLQAFLDQYPDSPWSLALRTNMGLAYYHLGYFSRAIDAWEAAWRDTRAPAQPATKRLADRALGELIRIHARIGHADRVNALLKEAESRPLQGAATEAVAGAREGLWVMRNDPGVAYLCGPMALKSILQFQGADSSRIAKINAVRSSPNGVTLDTVGQLAKQVNLQYTIAKRSPGTPIPLPAVVHWKINHYAAIIGEQNGRYHLKDPTFGQDLWISKEALEAETSNYFLIPRQAAKQAGWKTVAQAEAKKVFGMGYTQFSDPARTRPNDQKACDCKNLSPDDDSAEGAGADAPSVGMPSYNVHAMLVSLNLVDTPISYRPPKGPPVNFTLTYNQREAYQPANFSYFNFGQKWTSNWLAYIQDDPTNPGTSVRRIVGGGGAVWESDSYNSSTGAFGADPQDMSVLVRTSATSYERRMKDGSKEVYSQPDGATSYPRLVFLSQIVDPQGNAVSLNYDAQLRLTTVTDALGKQSTLGYGNANNPLLVTQITDPFGRTAKIGYDASGRLSDITDAMGMKSSFSYDVGTFINAMTTPYGTTQFAYGENGIQRWVNVTDPLGQTERVEYVHEAPGIPSSESSTPVGMNLFNSYLNDRNTYYWNAKAYAEGSGDYTRARITHWLHEKDNANYTAGVIESTKAPLENRVWYNYPNQPWTGAAGTSDLPISIGRVQADGSTQLLRYTYNAQGNRTSKIDPLGNQTQYSYADNGIDLLRVTQPNGAVTEYTYNSQHQPLTYRDAAGQLTSYAYNAAGQKISETDALGNTTRWEYDTNGFLQRIVNAAGKTEASYTYDAIGRIASRTDAVGYTLAYQYDALNRLTQVRYPDGTTRVQAWDKLDLASSTDQLGRTTQYAYNSVRNLVQVTDPLGRSIQYDYYPNGKMRSMTDSNGTVTALTYTPSDRLAERTVTTANGTVHSTSYSYDSTGQLTRKSQPDGTYTAFQYDNAGRMTAASDSRANNVSFTLDPNGNRSRDQFKDAAGTLTRQTTRMFDAMDRPVQVMEGPSLSSGTGPASGSGQLVKIAAVSARASGYYDNTLTPGMAIDGNLDTRWVSGGYPTQWIEIDLGAPVVLRSMRLMPDQDATGNTTHVITGDVVPSPTNVLGTLSGTTSNHEWVTFTPSSSPSPVRYIRITTTSSPFWVMWYELEFYK